MKKIAFLDSGLGGLNVLAQAVKQLPQENFLYYADDLNQPYGVKPADQVKSHVFQSVKNILQHDVKALVIACNTATAVAAKSLREQYQLPIVGVEPAVKPAVGLCNTTGKKVLVMATKLTLTQPRYVDLVFRFDQHHLVDSLAMSELVVFAEKLIFDGLMIDDFLKNKFKDLDLNQYGVLVLGCTHFLYFKNKLKPYFSKDIQIIDGRLGTINRLKNQLAAIDNLSTRGTGQISYMCSSSSPQYLEKMKKVFKNFN